MIKLVQIIICGLTLFTHTTWSMWDFAITTKSKILFYDDQWREVTTSAHQFDQLSAITFDETEEVIYFNDLLHNNGSIFSLKIPLAQEDPHIIEKVVQRTANESITSIAVDPLQRKLYWADQRQRAIYYVPIDAPVNVQPQIFLDFSGEHTQPDGIAIDVCRRRLYWTNSNFTGATIESADLDNPNDRHVIISDNLYLPHGIAVDQYTNRLYWVVDQQGMHFSVESAELDGIDRRVLVKGLNNVPLNLVVTKDAILWTDLTHNAVWSHAKISSDTAASVTDLNGDLLTPHKVLTFAENARGIVARTRFLTNLQNDRHCAAVIGKIKKRLLTPKPTGTPLATNKAPKVRASYCLNGGELIEQSGVCICKIGYKGPYCETSECHNYCVHGTCTMSSTSFPKCTCQRGFHGERCQATKCAGYCLNDGMCTIESNGEPSCECKDSYVGTRCEQNSTEICALFCRILKHEPDTYVPFGCHDICEELAEQSDNGHDIYAIPTYKHLEVCRNTSIFNSTVIVVLVSGVVISFALVLLIVHGVRRFYKPARPRIKKTFVVRKQATTASPDTPLTNRPIATEQCEITIENCCNMNICDTPCFDPKLVQQTLSRDSNAKEDKKMLIHNMEDDLY